MLFNLSIALEADKSVADPDFKPSKARQKSLEREGYREQKKLKAHVEKLRSSATEYARYSGYGDLFGLESPEPQTVKTAEELRHQKHETAAQEIAAREARLRASLQAAAAKDAMS